MVKYADLLSANFEYGGRGPKSFDCYGLVQEMYRRKGIETPNFDSPSREELQDYFANRLNHWRPTKPGPGVGVALKSMGRLHCGFMLGEVQFIHASESRKAVLVERIDSPLWRHNVVGYYDYE